MRFSPSAFDSFRRNTELRYTLKAPTTVSIYIVKALSAGTQAPVKTLVEDLSETKGTHSITWIGDTDQRLFAPAGVYLGVLRIDQRRFETIIQVFHF